MECESDIFRKTLSGKFEARDPAAHGGRDVEAEQGQHIQTRFVRSGYHVSMKDQGATPNPPGHSDERGKELMKLVPR